MCLGVPAKVLRIEGQTAVVSIGDVEFNASLALLEGIKKGDYVIIHTGFAIEKVDEHEALETIRLCREIEEGSFEVY
ncbi:MAG: HypC/HybG/HupF family hydrogenase formation chaperone [Bacteroidota bacterium]